MRARKSLAALLAILIAACASRSVEAPPRTGLAPLAPIAFEQWLAADAARAPAFARFEAMLVREGVSNVVANRELWVTDQLRPECVTAPYTMPAEAEWANIVAALRYVRDYVVPAIGPLMVSSAYRDEAFNTCIQGAPRSAHRGFYALDLTPLDPNVTRAQLIATLCPLHAREGERFDIGMGIYAGRRFHIDARGFRGWGGDYSRATFPCDGPVAVTPH